MMRHPLAILVALAAFAFAVGAVLARILGADVSLLALLFLAPVALMVAAVAVNDAAERRASRRRPRVVNLAAAPRRRGRP